MLSPDFLEIYLSANLIWFSPIDRPVEKTIHRKGMVWKKNDKEKSGKNKNGPQNAEGNVVRKENDEEDPVAEKMTYRRNSEEVI